MNQTSLVGRPLAKLTAAVVGFAEKRGVWSGPLTSSSPELARLWSGPRSSTGISVSETTALTYSAFWACVNNISTDVAKLPLMFYKRLEDGGKQLLRDHKLYRILHDEPNSEMDSMQFRETLQGYALTWGNGYAEIVRDGAGAVAQLWPITPDRVSVKRETYTGRLYYEVTREDGTVDRLAPENMFHLHGLGYDGVCGYSIVAKAMESIGLGLAAERFGGTFYGNGSTFGGVISIKESLTEPAKESFRKQMEGQHQGVDRAHRFLLLGNAATYERLGIPPNEAQFLETRQHQVEEICRWFRMPPHKIQHLLRSTNNNIEHQGIEYTVDTILPWCVRWEHAIRRKLVAPSERLIQFAEHKIDGLLRGDTASRNASYAIGRQWGWYSVDDIREMENLNPLPNNQGKMYLVPQNMAPADRINEIVDKQVAPNPTPVVPPPPGNRAEEAAQIAIAIRTALTDVEGRIRETTEKIVTVEADVLRWKASADGFCAESETLRAQLATEQAEANRLRAVLVEATVRADRLALEQETIRTEAETTKRTLEEQIAAVSADSSEAHSRAGTLAAERDTLRTECDALTAQVASAKADHARSLVELQTSTAAERHTAEARELELRTLAAEAAQHRDQRVAELVQRERDLADVQGQVATLTAELADLRTAAETATQAARTELADVRTTAEETAATQAAKLAAEQQARAELEKQLADIQAYAETLKAQVAAKDTDALTAAKAADEARAQAEAAESLRVAAEQAIAERDAKLIAEQTARVEMEAAIEALRAEETARAATATAAQQDAEAAKAIAAEATARVTTVRAEADQVAAKLAEEATQRAAVEATLRTAKETETARLQALVTAHRDLVLDAMAPLIWKETERARKNKGTPAKLKAWAESFYLLHEAQCIDALRATMRNHLVFIGSTQDVDTYTRETIHPQLDAALTQIRTVAEGDPDEFPVAIERLLTRWEQERPAAIADVVLQEEITYVRSLDRRTA
jgi:HK97 family phage portal protein